MAATTIIDELTDLLRQEFGETTTCLLEQLPNGKVSGNVVSEAFLDVEHVQRQTLIWEALDRRYNGDSFRLVGTLLAYTPDEWNIDLDGAN